MVRHKTSSHLLKKVPRELEVTASIGISQSDKYDYHKVNIMFCSKQRRSLYLVDNTMLTSGREGKRGVKNVKLLMDPRTWKNDI